MSTQALCGLDGKITGTGATEITKWDVTVTIDAIDATSFDSAGWVEKIGCLKGGSGTFTSIGTPSTVGVHANCTFSNKTAGYTIAGDIRISDAKRSVPVNGKITWDHTFVFTGTITAAQLI